VVVLGHPFRRQAKNLKSLTDVNAGWPGTTTLRIFILLFYQNISSPRQKNFPKVGSLEPIWKFLRIYFKNFEKISRKGRWFSLK